MNVDKFLEAFQIKLTDEECHLCSLHEAFDKEIDFIPCPVCNTPINGALDLIVVGEHNGCETKNITKCPVKECKECGSYIALIPTQIHWNANHDVYYTGEPCCLSDIENDELNKMVKDRIEAAIEQFVRRIKDGEQGLEPRNLLTWIQHKTTDAVAEFLYKYGYKRSITKRMETLFPTANCSMCVDHGLCKFGRFRTCGKENNWKHYQKCNCTNHKTEVSDGNMV